MMFSIMFYLIALVLLTGLPTYADEAPMAFEFQSQPLQTLTPSQIKKDVPEQTMKVYEPQEMAAKIYRGFPVTDLFQKIYGDKNKKADMAVFYCEDGYRADIPLKEFSEKTSLLAFAMADKSAFALKTSKGSIPLAPYYLVWDHPDAQTAAKDVYRWPYAVNKIGLIDSQSTYLPLVPKNANAIVQQGHKYFMKHCFSCHAINAVGGQRGPILNGFFLTQTDQHLKNYILDPKKMNKNTRMSGLSADLKDREAIAQKIISYGRFISGKP